MGGGINTYTYVNGNPLSRIDPLGLWSFTFGGYAGVGGEITFGNDNGNGFMTGRFGFGAGGGFSYDPNGGIPGAQPANRCEGGFVASVSGNTGFNAAILSANLEAGTARNYSNEQSSIYGGPSYSFGFGDSLGLGASASFGGQLTIYTGKR